MLFRELATTQLDHPTRFMRMLKLNMNHTAYRDLHEFQHVDQNLCLMLEEL